MVGDLSRLGRHGAETSRASVRAELLGLLQLGEQLLASTDTDQAAGALLEAVVAMYGFPRALLVTATGDRLTVLASHGLLRERPAGPRGSPVVSLAVDGVHTRLLLGLDEAREPWLSQLLPETADVLVVPMTTGDSSRGALLLQLPALREDTWQRAVVSPVERAASATGNALRTLSQLEQLRRSAATDALTLLADRRAFAHSLERELARSARNGQHTSVVMFDLDEFREINAQHGHEAGDDALCSVATALSEACRDLDLTARYGGEEFVVILPDCSAERAVLVAERLRAAVAGVASPQPLTASAGVASFPTHGSDVETLVRAADDALLVSKQAGRNRTTRASVPIQSSEEPARSAVG